MQAGPTKIEIESTGLSSALYPESVRVTGLGSGSGTPLRRVLSLLRVRLQFSLVARVPRNTQTILVNVPTSLFMLIRPFEFHLATLHIWLAASTFGSLHSHSASAQSHLATLESNINEEV